MRKSMQAQVDVERGRAVQAVAEYDLAIGSIDEVLHDSLDPALTRLQGLKSHTELDAYLGVSPAAEVGAGEGESIEAAADEAGL